MRLIWVIAVAGCYQPASEAPCGISCSRGQTCPGNLSCVAGICVGPNGCGSAQPDAPITGFVDGSDHDGPGGRQLCMGAGIGAICVPTPATAVMLPADIDTSAALNCTVGLTANSDEVCYVAGVSLTVDGSVEAHGTRPLLLFSASTLTINGELSVASTGAMTGASADDSTCDGGTPPSNTAGGAGGSYGTEGGAGGLDGDMVPGGTAGSAVTTILHIRGGCPGQAGAASGGAGGHGGGAVYLIAMSLGGSGQINASGAGGDAGPTNADAGGAGAGTGGYIGIDVASTSFSGSIFANGGGGASGSAQQGVSSAGGISTSPGLPASGGMSNAMAGNGGIGATVAEFARPGGAAGNGGGARGGGGGGGGLGVLQAFPPATRADLMSGASCSPQPR